MKPKKELGTLEIVFLCAGAIIGSGIFIIPAIGAEIAGYSSLIVWVISGLVAIMMSLVFAELSSIYEDSGGIYKFIKNAFGEKMGFVSGWAAWVISWVTMAMLVAAVVEYMSFLYPFSAAIRVIIALIILGSLTLVNLVGIKDSVKVQKILTSFTFLLLLSFVAVMFTKADLASVQLEPLSFSTFFLAAAILIEPYIGWQEATFLTEETKNSRKAIPKGIFFGTIIIACLYFLVAFASLISAHIVPGGLASFVNSNAPLALLFGNAVPFGSIIIIIGAIVVIVGCINSWMATSPRLTYAMAKDQLIPFSFSKLSSRGVPKNAILFQFVISFLIFLFADFVLHGGFDLLLKTMVPVALFIYTFVFLSLLKLKQKVKENEIKFNIIFEDTFSLLSALYSFILFIFLVFIDIDLLLKGFSLVVLGIPFYLLIKLSIDEKSIEKFFDKFSWLWDKLFPLWYGDKEMRFIVDKIKVKKGHIVLDFGCGTGRTTSYIAKKVGKAGRVVSVDISRVQLKKAMERVEEVGKLSNVIFVKENLLGKKPVFDSVVSVGVIEHFDKPEKKIKKLIGLIKPGGCFCFMSFGKVMGFPPPYFLSSEKQIKELFKKIGVDVSVKKVHKHMAEYWFIWGRKK